MIDIDEVVFISPRITNSDGVGRHSISILKVLTDNKIKYNLVTVTKKSVIGRLQAFLHRIYLGNFFDLFFIFYVDILLLTKYRKLKSISPSVITGFSTSQMNFSSCHLHSLIVANQKWKLIDPRNFFYVVIEFLQYKFCKQAIFISRIQKAQFNKYYGKRVKKSHVVHPVLCSNNFPVDHVDKVVGSNIDGLLKKCLFIGYNFRLKGLLIAIKAISNLKGVELDVIGDDPKFNKGFIGGSVSFIGSLNFKDIPWNDYSFFIFPSFSDSYAFVIQEAVRNGLIPIVSSQVGASEVLIDAGYDIFVVDQGADMKGADIDLLACEYEKKMLKNMTKLALSPRSDNIYNHVKYGHCIVNLL